MCREDGETSAWLALLGWLAVTRSIVNGAWLPADPARQTPTQARHSARHAAASDPWDAGGRESGRTASLVGRQVGMRGVVRELGEAHAAGQRRCSNTCSFSMPCRTATTTTTTTTIFAAGEGPRFYSWSCLPFAPFSWLAWWSPAYVRTRRGSGAGE